MQGWSSVLNAGPSVAAWLVITGILGGAFYRWVIYPNVVKPLQEIVKDVSALKAEVHPNGGASLKDQVTRIEARQKRVEKLVRDKPTKQ